MTDKQKTKENSIIEECREKIGELLDEIENIWILEQILSFVKNMTKEGD